MQVHALYRYPVKGMTPERLDAADLGVGATVPGDRAFAVENGPSGFDAAEPTWQPKTRFLCWMKNPRLARVEARYDPAGGVLALAAEGFEPVSGALDTAAGRDALERWLGTFMGEEQEGPLRVLAAPGHTFSDCGANVLSLINMASVADLGAGLDRPFDPLRFRGNLYMDGLAPWAESTWLGQTITVGADVRLRVVKRIKRCLATHVDPDRGVRDVETLRLLREQRGDAFCGVYAEVIAAGTVRPGDAMTVAD
jgi:uncharacterized protein YcbX